MRAGELRNPITIETNTPGRDAYGGVTNTWTTYLSAWARMENESGGEHLGSDSVQSTDQHLFTIRYQPGITNKMRVNFSGRIYDIVAINNTLELGKTLLIRTIERYDELGGDSGAGGFDTGFSIGFG